MMRHVASIVLVAITGLLSGCSSATDTQSPLGLAVNRLRGAQPDMVPRFARLARDETAVLQVGLVDQKASFAMLLERRDGAFDYWLTGTGEQIVLQHGMLHSTRGFGEGLLASDISQPLARVRGMQPGYSDRFHSFLDGNDRAVTRTYRCLIENSGAQTIELGTGPVNTVLMTENCRSLDQEFTNFYWVVPATGRIIQSRQWSGPRLGALSTRVVMR